MQEWPDYPVLAIGHHVILRPQAEESFDKILRFAQDDIMQNDSSLKFENFQLFSQKVLDFYNKVL